MLPFDPCFHKLSSENFVTESYICSNVDGSVATDARGEPPANKDQVH